MTQNQLNLVHKENGFDVEKSTWEQALQHAQPDPVVQIKHAAIKGDAQYRIHVASIPNRVGCHFHAHGNEGYAVVSGKGTLHWGRVDRTHDHHKVLWEQPIDVCEGDSFVIPEGYAHQLAKRGNADLVVLFGCPDSHLDDTQDRHLLPDAVTLSGQG